MNKNASRNLRKEKFNRMAEMLENAISNKSSFYMDAYDCIDLEQWYLWDKGDAQKALKTLDYGLSLHPQNKDLLYEKANIYLDSGHTYEGQKIAELLEEDEEYSDKAKFLNAKALMNDGLFECAKEYTDSIENKKNLDLICDIVYLYMENKHPDEAYEWLQLGYEDFCDEEDYNAATAEFYSSNGNVQEAIGYCNKAIDLNPYHAPYWELLANIYFQDEQIEKAIEACDYAIVCDKDFAQTYVTRASCYLQLGNMQAARKDYTEAEQRGIVPQGFTTAMLGLNDMANNEWDNAIENLESVQDLNDNDDTRKMLPVISANLAYCYYEKGEKDKAFKVLNKALSENIECVEIYLTLGRIYKEEGNEEKSTAAWQKALSIAPMPDTWLEIGISFFRTSNLEQARMAFEQALALDPNFRRVHEKLAVICILKYDAKGFLEHNKHFRKPLNQNEQNIVVEAIETGDMVPLLPFLQELFLR